MTKLTKAQWCFLVDISERPERCNESYAPGKKLVELGYATIARSSFGVATFTITDAGREAITKGPRP